MTTAQKNLRRAAAITVVLLGLAVGVTAVFDHGRYADEFRQNGLLGYLSLPSLLIFQAGFLTGSLILLFMSRRVLRSPTALLAFGVAVTFYLGSVLLMYLASRRSEFGITDMGIAFLLFFAPSAVILLIGVPVFVVYAATKRNAEQSAT